LLTLVELRCPYDGVSVECVSDGLKYGKAVLAAGIDDGADSGEEVGSLSDTQITF